MDYVILKVNRRLGTTSYHASGENHPDMYLLATYLTDDVYDINHWIRLISDCQYGRISSNYSFLEKEGDCILMGCDLDRSEETPDPPSFRIPNNQLIYILEQWKQVWAHKPDEVIITRENDIYQVIQKSNDMSQA